MAPPEPNGHNTVPEIAFPEPKRGKERADGVEIVT